MHYQASFYAMGSAMIYATTGSIELINVAQVLNAQLSETPNMLLITSRAIMMLVAFSFKLSLFPFHTWAPDVYEEASAPLAGYMSIVPKISAYYCLKLIVYMFLREPVKELNVVYYNISKPLMVIIGVAVVATVASAQPLISYITDMVSMSAYTVR